jgi:hypothetical protein
LLGSRLSRTPPIRRDVYARWLGEGKSGTGAFNDGIIASFALYAAVALWWLLPDRRIEQVLAKDG